jgi:hypothetical protein
MQGVPAGYVLCPRIIGGNLAGTGRIAGSGPGARLPATRGRGRGRPRSRSREGVDGENHSIFAWWPRRTDRREFIRTARKIVEGMGRVPPCDCKRGEVAGGVARRQAHRLPGVLLRRPLLLRRRGCHPIGAIRLRQAGKKETRRVLCCNVRVTGLRQDVGGDAGLQGRLPARRAL